MYRRSAFPGLIAVPLREEKTHSPRRSSFFNRENKAPGIGSERIDFFVFSVSALPSYTRRCTFKTLPLKSAHFTPAASPIRKPVTARNRTRLEYGSSRLLARDFTCFGA